MKVLLTGATGFIGRHVLQSMRDRDIPFVTVGRTIPQGCIETEFIQADLLASLDFDEIMARAEASHLLHLAWYAEHGKYWTSPLNLRWVEATVRMVEAFCKAGGKRVVAAGTCAEYDWSYGYCREDVTPTNPDTLYGVTKDATRRLVMAICKDHGASCGWGRIFIPYGPGEHTSRLIPSLIDVFQGKREPFSVNANAYRDFLHVSDVADAFLALSNRYEAGIFNVCSGQPVQVNTLVRNIARIFNNDPDLVLSLECLNTEKDPVFLAGDNTKLSKIGWRCLISLKQGLEHHRRLQEKVDNES